MSDLLLAKLFYFISWFHIKLSHTLIFRCWFISFEIYAKVGVVDSFFPIIITMSLPMSFCTNSMALPLAYQVNGSNKFIIVFLVFVSVLTSIHSSDKKMPLHVKKNIEVKHVNDNTALQPFCVKLFKYLVPYDNLFEGIPSMLNYCCIKTYIHWMCVIFLLFV